MKPDSTASKIFFAFDLKYVSPDFVFEEFMKYESECMEKSGLSKEEFEKRKEKIFGRISFVSYGTYGNFLKEAIDFSPDEDDAPYFALALKLESPLWSNDSILKKQERVTVLNTRELIEII